VGALALLGAFSNAQAADEKFEIRSASVTSTDGVYALNAKLHFALPTGARQAIRDGVALTLALEIEVHRARRWWLNESVAKLEQRYEIAYHALSERYLLRNLNSGDQLTFNSLDAALDTLSTQSDLPVIDQSLLSPSEQYEIRLRALLDVRTLPDTLRMVLFWTDDWRQKTDWYLWPLRQ
jgi:hypothetical protein